MPSVSPSGNPSTNPLLETRAQRPQTELSGASGILDGRSVSCSINTPEEAAKRRSFFSQITAKIAQIFSCLFNLFSFKSSVKATSLHPSGTAERPTSNREAPLSQAVEEPAATTPEQTEAIDTPPIADEETTTEERGSNITDESNLSERTSETSTSSPSEEVESDHTPDSSHPTAAEHLSSPASNREAPLSQAVEEPAATTPEQTEAIDAPPTSHEELTIEERESDISTQSRFSESFSRTSSFSFSEEVMNSNSQDSSQSILPEQAPHPTSSPEAALDRSPNEPISETSVQTETADTLSTPNIEVEIDHPSTSPELAVSAQPTSILNTTSPLNEIEEEPAATTPEQIKATDAPPIADEETTTEESGSIITDESNLSERTSETSTSSPSEEVESGHTPDSSHPTAAEHLSSPTSNREAPLSQAVEEPASAIPEQIKATDAPPIADEETTTEESGSNITDQTTPSTTTSETNISSSKHVVEIDNLPTSPEQATTEQPIPISDTRASLSAVSENPTAGQPKSITAPLTPDKEAEMYHPQDTEAILNTYSLTKDQKEKLLAGNIVVVTTQQGSDPRTFTAYQLAENGTFAPKKTAEFFANPVNAHHFLPKCKEINPNNITVERIDNTTTYSAVYPFEVKSKLFLPIFWKSSLEDNLEIKSVLKIKDLTNTVTFSLENKSQYIENLGGSLITREGSTHSLTRYEITIGLKSSSLQLILFQVLANVVQDILNDIIDSSLQ